ncbi:MAG TPA: response regulator transcription factor [Dongiaceae bacterium]
MKILLVEDHRDLRDMIAEHFSGRGFVIDAVGCAEDARAALSTGGYDVLVLDLGLPDADGMTLLREVPTLVDGGLPTLVVTARDSLDARLLGLNEGADDYLVKPFSLLELEARVRAVLRRPGTREAPKLVCGALLYDPAAREVTVRGQPVDMSRRESDLLELLLRASGRVVIRDFLEEQLYSFNEPVTPNALEAVVSRLRRRLTNADAGVRIETRRGIGYRLVAGQEGAGAPP